MRAGTWRAPIAVNSSRAVLYARPRPPVSPPPRPGSAGDATRSTRRCRAARFDDRCRSGARLAVDPDVTWAATLPGVLSRRTLYELARERIFAHLAMARRRCGRGRARLARSAYAAARPARRAAAARARWRGRAALPVQRIAPTAATSSSTRPRRGARRIRCRLPLAPLRPRRAPARDARLRRRARLSDAGRRPGAECPQRSSAGCALRRFAPAAPFDEFFAPVPGGSSPAARRFDGLVADRRAAATTSSTRTGRSTSRTTRRPAHPLLSTRASRRRSRWPDWLCAAPLRGAAGRRRARRRAAFGDGASSRPAPAAPESRPTTGGCSPT